MAKADKLLQRIRNNPKTVAFADLDTVLRHYGFEQRQPRSGSSHYVYTKGRRRITVPYKRPYVKEVYIRQVLDIFDQIDEESA
jgi:hypothetical protein